ncbi:uncharacterized protein PpBr36_09937 [Pyricularia pennisetigena]|uniref:uncharacterized protein n=1 Tax=Pyricularia pennisetigena TaxID=1578925 RepID=UPI001152AC9D|nr:uncharacterized protein PpBr36_09937 [Pyricularia pennisetigena]TLS22400.1 hypothetical protein PpBr36_09937 [Pyricularia pennisetigena]
MERKLPGVPVRGQVVRSKGLVELVLGLAEDERLDVLDVLEVMDVLDTLEVLEVDELVEAVTVLLAAPEVLEDEDEDDDDDDDDDDEPGAGENMVRGTPLVWEAESVEAESLQLPKRG